MVVKVIYILVKMVGFMGVIETVMDVKESVLDLSDEWGSCGSKCDFLEMSIGSNYGYLLCS